MEVREEIKKIADGLEERFKAFEEQNKTNGKSNEDTVSEVKAMAVKHTELSELIEKREKEATEKQKVMQDHLDDLDIKLQKQSAGEGKTLTMVQGIKNLIDKNQDEIKISRNRAKTPIEFNLDYKVVGDMGSSTHLTGEVVAPTRVPGVFYDPANPVRIRTLVSGGSTNSNLIRFIQESGGEGGATMVAEGGAKPQIDKDLLTVDRSVRKIASYFRVPEEMMDDISFLSSYLSTRGMDDLKDVEDNQILTGDNTGQNLDGIIPNAATYVDAFTDTAATEYDILRFAVQQVAILHYRATGILLHPTRVAKMSILKDSQNNYLNPSVYNGVNPNIGGIPIIQNTAIAENSFLVGDFVRGTQLWDRMSANVRFYDQDRDNAIVNMVTIVTEERLCNTVYRPNSFVKSTDFDAAIAAAKV